MPIRIFDGRGAAGTTTLEEILRQGKAIDDNLACGKRIVAALQKRKNERLIMPRIKVRNEMEKSGYLKVR